MTGPTMIPLLNGGPTGRHRVVCAEHQLDRTVDTEAHATNLLALHLRVDHPGPDTGPALLDLTAAARYLAVCRTEHGEADPQRSDSGPAVSAYYAALDMWEALTGLSGEAALTYACIVAGHQTTAVIPPF